MIPGADQEKTGSWKKDNGREYQPGEYVPATEEARAWQGFGTALKPALEPITLARKPFKSTVAANVLEHGTGALNVDGCRVGSEPPAPRNAPKKVMRGGKFHAGADVGKEMSHYNPTQGRWPANLIHDGSDEVVGLFPVTKERANKGPSMSAKDDFGFTSPHSCGSEHNHGIPGEKGSAARFFYCAKASKNDRGADNKHPTVKPTDLMRYLVRLVTPPGGTVLDPFMGSGSTGKAAMLEGFDFIGIELDPEYLEIARARIETSKDLFAA